MQIAKISRAARDKKWKNDNFMQVFFINYKISYIREQPLLITFVSAKFFIDCHDYELYYHALIMSLSVSYESITTKDMGMIKVMPA